MRLNFQCEFVSRYISVHSISAGSSSFPSPSPSPSLLYFLHIFMPIPNFNSSKWFVCIVNVIVMCGMRPAKREGLENIVVCYILTVAASLHDMFSSLIQLEIEDDDILSSGLRICANTTTGVCIEMKRVAGGFSFSIYFYNVSFRLAISIKS